MAYIKPTDRNKPWAIRQMTEDREIKEKEIRNSFRIYCEGENTEPEYFKSFPINTETEVIAIGLGRSKTALVQKAIDLFRAERLLKRQKEYDSDRQLWVVFDYDVRGDANEKQDFNKAIELAHQNGIKVAYSNDSFELWFILHDHYQTAAITRREYYEMLSQKFGFNYENEGKSKEFAQSLYGIYLNNQSTAIQNADKLFAEKQELSYADQNPVTTVYQLVVELNKCIKK